MANQQKVWLITGCSSGLGRAIATAALRSNANVVVTARNMDDIKHFGTEFPNNTLLMNLDVTNQQQINNVVTEAKKKFGRIDVLVNNAGCGVFGAVEEVPDKDVRKLFDTNFFGALDMTRAVLPIMRAQKSGHIINVSAVGGITATQCLGIFNASKFALEGMTEALEPELSPLGIKVTLIEPGPSRTNFSSHSVQTFNVIKDYDEPRKLVGNIMKQYEGNQPGDPDKIAQTVLQIVDNPVPPLHLPLGKFSIERVREKLSAMNDTINTWEAVSNETDFKK